ncbi:phage resistance protein [Egibacter rhizosphaerae]|uniref:Phage resistance protein n=1 Tax=Egibacter rhizosphaerae TaxID=1670831 RepID=A0A411YBE7_9ACTN|nr:phage resistance protein [Egibacter rhizosphaerae]QBI18516.1 phage resistance protein [Egibacter rhizosphaerae]
MSQPLLRELIDLPERVSKSDYVIGLADGVADPERTLREYVVTDQLAECFDDALGLVASAVEGHASKGAYLHGSFGSGKSHFMAVLHLILQGEPAARGKPELAEPIARHAPKLDGRRFMLVPYHMVGAESMEQAILGGYVDHVRAHHPGAKLPAVYVSDGLLADAKRLRGQMGDDAFFGLLGEGGGDEGFGDLAGGWDPASFDAAMAAPPDSEQRQALVSDVIDQLFSGTIENRQATASGFVPFEQGLSAISRHAAGLGYDGLILFLDELILWFASRMADESFVNSEGPKVAKLVEAQRADRPAPIVSFIARQRDLRDFVGQGVPGAERINFGQILEWWEGRFDVIELADRNLATIIEKRLLRPKSEAAARQLDEAFEATAAASGRAFDTLLTSDGDKEMFRRLYPFNPALVETLVAVSGYLQRERTALRLIGELLADKRDHLTVGDLVPLGDLYDVIADAEEPFSDELKRHFNRARDLYAHKLKPKIAAEHDGVDEEQLERLPDDHPARTDDRLAKTLLLAALVPEVEPLRGLTVRRLADLNHGTIKSPIAGAERATVLNKVKGWAAEIGELRVDGDEQDPHVGLRLTGVDTEAILDQVAEVDNLGQRRAKVRELLSESLGVEEGGGLTASTVTLVWRGSKRTIDVRFANIRDHADIPTSELVADDRPRMVIDYPFDEPGHGPADDRARLQQLGEQLDPTPTACWIPLFLTEQAMEQLGRLVVMEHVLTGDRFEGATRHLAPQDRVQARELIDNQARTLRQRLVDVLRQAYGIDTPDESMVRTDLRPHEQFPSLDPSLAIRPPTAATLSAAFTEVLDQLLASQFPAHPNFGEEVRIGDLRTALEHITRAVQNEDGRVDVPKSDRRAVNKVLAPLKLADVGEAHLMLRRDWRDHFYAKQREHPGEAVTVERLRQWIDEPQPMGLEERVTNLVISAYALMANKAMSLRGAPVGPIVERLDPSVELRDVELPDEDVYAEAARRVGGLFGVVASPVRSAASVAELAGPVREHAKRDREPARELVRVLEAHRDRLALGDEADRLRTAQAAAALLDTVATADDRDVVEAIAAVEVPTSLEAMARSTSTAADVRRALQETNWALLEQTRRLDGEWASHAAGIIERVQRAATAEEVADSLTDTLRTAEHEATDLLSRALQRREPDDKSGGGPEGPIPGTDTPPESTGRQQGSEGPGTYQAGDTIAPPEPDEPQTTSGAAPEVGIEGAFVEPSGQVRVHRAEVQRLVEALREHADELESLTVEWEKRSR